LCFEEFGKMRKNEKGRRVGGLCNLTGTTVQDAFGAAIFLILAAAFLRLM
jgi:hypothetical protein